MEIQLTEELSNEMYKHFSVYNDLIIKINELAYFKIYDYYHKYLIGGNYLIKPMSSTKFFKKMVMGSASVVVLDEPYHIVTSYSNTIFFDKKYMSKLYVHLENSDIDLFYTAIGCPNIKWSEQSKKVKDLLNLFQNYLTTPYKVDLETIKLFEIIKEANFNRINALHNCGVVYDL